MYNRYSENPAEDWAINKAIFAGTNYPLWEVGSGMWHLSRIVRATFNVVFTIVLIGGILWTILGL